MLAKVRLFSPPMLAKQARNAESVVVYFGFCSWQEPRSVSAVELIGLDMDGIGGSG